MAYISMVVTAFNYAQYLDECLDSCLEQACDNIEYEVIVVDDGSTDETKSLLGLRSDPRLRVIHIKNSGIEIASNVGFEAAKGKFIVRVDADDVLEANYLRQMCTCIDQGADFAYPDYSLIDENSRPQGIVRLPEFDQSEIFARGDFLATGTLYSAKILRQHGCYATHTKNSGLENYELIIRLLVSGSKGLHLSEPLFRYRRHGANISTSKIDKIVNYGRALCKSYGLGDFRTNQYHPYKLVLPRQ